jgi:hypothetical protein
MNVDQSKSVTSIIELFELKQALFYTKQKNKKD